MSMVLWKSIPRIDNPQAAFHQSLPLSIGQATHARPIPFDHFEAYRLFFRGFRQRAGAFANFHNGSLALGAEQVNAGIRIFPRDLAGGCGIFPPR